MVLEREQRDGAPDGLVLIVDLLALPLGLLLLVDDKVLLVQALEMVDHPPIVEPVCPFLPLGDHLAAVVAASEVRLAWLVGEMIPEWNGLGCHTA